MQKTKNKKIVAPVQKNQKITIEITSLTLEGQGVGKFEGFTVFVPFALPEEKATVLIIKIFPKYAIGKLIDVERSSPKRIYPPCPVFGKCGGCSMQHINYNAQADFKRQQAIDALERIGKIGNINNIMAPIINADSQWNYRNKASFPVSQKQGAFEYGFFALRSHNIVPINQCKIQTIEAIRVANTVSRWAKQFFIRAYDEETKTGDIRHIVVRTAKNADTMVTIVTTGTLNNAQELIAMIREAEPQVKSISHNINRSDSNIILGDKYRTLWGSDFIIDEILGLKFRVSPGSFFQVNVEQTQKLYSKALEIANVNSTSIVIDAYCGVGTISLLFAKNVKTVIGIEVFAQAVEDAKDNAKLNNIENTNFICSKVEDEIKNQVQKQKIDVIVVDPPRKGCEPSFIESLLVAQIPKIIYVSCNPSTLARDCEMLSKKYEVFSATCVDMFPQTGHVETVVGLQLK